MTSSFSSDIPRARRPSVPLSEVSLLFGALVRNRIWKSESLSRAPPGKAVRILESYFQRTMDTYEKRRSDNVPPTPYDRDLIALAADITRWETFMRSKATKGFPSRDGPRPQSRRLRVATPQKDPPPGSGQRSYGQVWSKKRKRTDQTYPYPPYPPRGPRPGHPPPSPAARLD